MSPDQSRIFISDSLHGKVDEKRLIDLCEIVPTGWYEDPHTFGVLRYFFRTVDDARLLVIYEAADDKFGVFIGSEHCGTTDSLSEACSLAEQAFCGCHVRKPICTDAR